MKFPENNKSDSDYRIATGNSTTWYWRFEGNKIMASGSYNYSRYGDNLAREKWRRFFIRISIATFCGAMLGGISGYALFYSGWLDINSISINGLKSVTEDQVSPTIKTMIEKNVLPILRIRFQENVIFFDSDMAKESILAQFPAIKEVEIIKELPHEIIVNLTERVALGTWCLGQNCYYFDDEGVLWGKALRSSGSLLLNVEDLRKSDNSTKVDVQLLAGIKELISALENISIKINRIEIPADSIGEFRAYTTHGYYLILNMESSVKDQVTVLRILLKEKGEGFNPQYIDLKVEGRAYYK